MLLIPQFRFSINTYKFVNAHGKENLFRWHFRSHLGQLGLNDSDAVEQNFLFHTQDLLNAINDGGLLALIFFILSFTSIASIYLFVESPKQLGNYPRWDFEVQVIDPNNMPTDFDPQDPTKEWPEDRFPFRKVGEFWLNETASQYFFDNEQIAFAPSRMVPGILPSDDKLLQARLVACNENVFLH